MGHILAWETHMYGNHMCIFQHTIDLHDYIRKNKESQNYGPVL